MLSETFWRTRFGARSRRSSARRIMLDRVPHTVIGVVPDPPSFVERRAGLGAAGVDAATERASATITTTAASRS